MGLRKSIIWAVIATILSAGIIQNAFAADNSTAISLRNWQPPVDGLGLFYLDRSATLSQWNPWAGLYIQFSKDPLILKKTDGQKESLIGWQNSYEINAALGLADGLDIGVNIPVVIQDSKSALGGGFSMVGVGDLRISTKIRLLDSRRYGFGLAAVLPLGLPTSRGNDYLGDSELSFSPGLIFDWTGYGVSVAANAGYSMRSKHTLADLVVDDEILYGLGMGYRPINLLEVSAEIYGKTTAGNAWADSTVSPLEWLAGLRFYLPLGFRTGIAGGTGILNGYGSPQFRGIAFVGWTPEKIKSIEDKDRDGIDDDDDYCWEKPEDFDGFEDTDGCPDPDNDKDDIPDNKDSCPLQPETYNGYRDQDGCPDEIPDADKDGIWNDKDACPNAPEDEDGFQDEDGCPDLDNDADGISDDDDRCPDKAEDMDGFEDTDGCPEPDNDKDGIADTEDTCPLKPETFNGFEDRDGCPDSIPKEKIYISHQENKIVVRDNIFFVQGKARVQRKSIKLITQIARLITSHREISMVYVIGHTDDRGSAKRNMNLSKRRAQAVVKLLRRYGVPGRKLKAIGKGEEEPIATNKTAKGRAVNRRVEFRVELK